MIKKFYLCFGSKSETVGPKSVGPKIVEAQMLIIHFSLTLLMLIILNDSKLIVVKLEHWYGRSSE